MLCSDIINLLLCNFTSTCTCKLSINNYFAYRLYTHFFQVSLKNDEIKRLKANIKTIINLAEDSNQKIQTEVASKQSMEMASFESRKGVLEEGIASLSKRHQELLKDHREKEQELRKVC